MEHEPTAYDITHGIDDDALSGLTEDQREIIVTLLARVSERSYRRGFQQGSHLEASRPHDIRAELHVWRYGPSTDVSPWADCPRIEPAWNRLFTENQSLERVGLGEPEHGAGFLVTVDPTYRARDESIQ